MNIKLVFSLSLTGLVMGFITLYLPSKAEPFCWLPIFLFTAWQIGKYAQKKYFLHGFLTGLLFATWTTIVHLFLSDIYMSHHLKEAAQYAKVNREIHLTPAMTMIVMTPVIGSFFGLLSGAFAAIAAGIISDR